MSGTDLLNFHTGLYGLKPDQNRNQRVLERVGLLGQEQFKVGAYSKGMRQRLGLACALLPNPKLLFLDEPTSALDPIGRKDVRDIILSLRDEGATVFFNSHLLSEVEAVCDSITIINNGVVAKSGQMNDLLREKISLIISCSQISQELIQTLKTNFDSNLAWEEERPGQDCVTLRLNLKERDEVADIANLLITQGVRVYGLTPGQETLESIFIKTVGEVEEASKQ
jgi:ABC-2 type transport system ATP-binding protein